MIKNDKFLIFLGDIALLYISLYAVLTARYGFSFQELDRTGDSLLVQHILPFTIIFIAWLIVFVIVGLYEKRTSIEAKKVYRKLWKAYALNAGIAITFFYLFPSFGIAPKFNLLFIVLISMLALFAWRVYLFRNSRETRSILVLASGHEAEELVVEFKRLGSKVLYMDSNLPTSTKDELSKLLVGHGHIDWGIIDFNCAKIEEYLPVLYNTLYKGVEYTDICNVYESVFERIPLSLIDHGWFIKYVSVKGRTVYDFLKRSMDIVASIILLPIYLITIPFVWLLIKLDDNGPLYVSQERIGRGNKVFSVKKYRSMNVNDGGKWPEKNDSRITKVGKFLRKSRIDEIPQLISVLKGDVSLIGPRPDIIDLGKELVAQVPYYSMRNSINPGLSGWAQIKQDVPPHSLEETKLRLSYDFYYIKNRSLFLDVIIALRTIRTLASRLGR